MSEKRKRGDRSDARRIRELDAMHVFMPYLLPNRTDNEAVMNETFDMTAVVEYVAKKNAGTPEFKYTIFHVICAAIAKTIAQRPKLNYFISNKKYYERNKISLSFTVKKAFRDDAGEALAIVTLDKDSDTAPIDAVYEKVKKIVTEVKHENRDDGATDVMGVLTKLPPFLIRFAIGVLNFLDNHRILPSSLLKLDPYHTTVFLSNLGSIKMSATYHHLTNWGTNSVFVLVGEMKKRPIFNPDGTYEMRDALEMGLTIDERIADGFYFLNSLKILRKILENPELLDRPLGEAINLD